MMANKFCGEQVDYSIGDGQAYEYDTSLAGVEVHEQYQGGRNTRVSDFVHIVQEGSLISQSARLRSLR